MKKNTSKIFQHDKNNLTTIQPRKRAAFTLAEVLITLAIIGVVAAMTIPTLVNEYRKKVFVTKTKYTYSLLANVIEKSIADNGPMSTWDFGEDYSTTNSARFVNTYITPYIQVLDDGDLGKSNSNVYSNPYHIKLKNGVTMVWILDGTSAGENPQPPAIIYVLASFNGNIKPLQDESRDYSHTDVVIGISPRQSTIQFFNWCGTGSSSRECFKTHEIYGCNKDIEPNKRLHCGALLQKDNWQIKDDYPW